MSEFERFVEVIAALRGENGCPWDKEQTHESLKRYIIEEAAEVVAAVNIYEKTGNAANLQEELGDLLLQVVLQARIAEEEGLFNIEDVAKGIADKMVRRHPHVFEPGMETDSMEEIHRVWDEIKEKEKAGKEWMDAYLPEAFDESKEHIETARKRKEEKKRLQAQEKG